MKTVLIRCTQYFLSIRKRPDRAAIKVEWITAAILNPLVVETQSDGRIRHWAWVEEVHRYLRVILLDDEETVHNAFFDRGFREE
jgi:predicted ATPase